jgi:hypothetical protein
MQERKSAERMSCEQVLVSGYRPNEDHEVIGVTAVKNVSECSDRCCGDERCGIFSYGPGKCTLYRFPDQPVYLPFPNTKNMVRVDDKNLVTGILMKRKIATWMPWIFWIIVLFIFSMWYTGHL